MSIPRAARQALVPLPRPWASRQPPRRARARAL